MTDTIKLLNERAASYGALRQSSLTAVAMDCAAVELAAANAQIDELTAELAAAHTTIHQLRDTAAKAATEYAEEVGRLRRDCDGWRVQFEMSRESVAVARERIGKLEAEIGVLRGALERIGGVNGPYGYPFPEANPDYPAFAVMEARAALTEPTDEG